MMNSILFQGEGARRKFSFNRFEGVLEAGKVGSGMNKESQVEKQRLQ